MLVHCVCAHGHSFSLRLVPYFLEQMIGNAQYVFLRLRTRTQTFIYSRHMGRLCGNRAFFIRKNEAGVYSEKAFIRRYVCKRILNNS